MSIIVDTERFHPNPYLEKENDFGDPFVRHLFILIVIHIIQYIYG
jgi:hypothetical protein